MWMPVSVFALGITQAVGTFNNIKSHLGYELYPKFFKIPPLNMLITATNHSLHHTQYNGNYGLYFRFWDIVCGTELKTTRELFGEIHERENAEVIDNTEYKLLTIDELEKENEDTISVYFRPDDQQFYQYTPGQYLTLKFKVNGKVCHRCFSLSSTPQKDDFLRFTAKRNGEVTHYLLNEARVGDTVEAFYPVGEFEINKKCKHHVMIAGGSGITPLFSMINYLLKFEPQHQVTLLYANRSEGSIIFRNELDKLAGQYPQFSYSNFISGQNRIKVEDLQPYVDANFYLCGPNSLKDAMESHLKKLNVSKSQIHMEHYADGYVPLFGLV
jgi:ferredoxin-NADP reductase